MDLSYGILYRRNNTKKERSSPFSISMTCTRVMQPHCSKVPILLSVTFCRFGPPCEAERGILHRSLQKLHFVRTDFRR
jgi:hypothetical protein